jgi:LysR family transcriptional activator of nhaA
VGQLTFSYADEIFSLGRELLSAVRGGDVERPLRLTVGLLDAVPKTVASRILQPALTLAQPVHLVVQEGKLTDLVADLVVHRLDMVIADTRVEPRMSRRIFHHDLGDSAVTFLAAPAVARRLRRRFPDSLDGAAALLPTDGTALRSALETWFEDLGIRPQVVAEIEDGALLKDLGGRGHGFFAVPSVVADEVVRRHRVRRVGETADCRASFLALSAERRITHPAVQAITASGIAGQDRAKGGKGNADR